VNEKFCQEELKLARIRDLFPCEYFPGKNPDPAKEESWHRCIITEKGMYRLAAKNGVRINVYPRHVISLVKNATKELMGLEDACNGWRGMGKITEREVASTATSILLKGKE
jgi:hypothetical protein